MAQLTKGLFCGGANQLFGLRCDQIRDRVSRMIKNAGWFNRAGEKLGWGDLSVDDFFRIRREIEEGEMFIILNETDSFWKFVKQPGLLGRNAVTNPDKEAPGVDYVAAKAHYIITKRPENGFGMHFVCDDEECVNIHGMMFHPMKRKNVKAFLISTVVAPVASEP